MKINILFFSLVLFASSQLFAAELNKSTQKVGLSCPFKYIPSALESDFKKLPDGFEYPRDYSFPLKHKGGVQYIPRQVSSDILDSFDYYKFAILPGFYIDKYGLEIAQYKMKHFNIRRLSSSGFQEKFALISRYFKDNNIDYLQPNQTIIEGGNIFFTRMEDGTDIAIIGDHALFLTYLAFEINGDWPLKQIEEIGKKLPENTELHYQLARNMQLFAQFVPQLQRLNALKKAEKMSDYSDSGFRTTFFKSLRELKEQLLTPIKEEEKRGIKDEARLTTAKLAWCEHLIAEEIKLDKQNIIYLPQRNYHIDLDCLIGANNKVFLRSPGKESEEEKLWALALAALEKQLPADLIGDVPKNLSDTYVFCGLYLSSQGRFLHPPGEKQLESQWKKFLIEAAGFKDSLAVGFRSEYENLRAGFHCMTQEYF